MREAPSRALTERRAERRERMLGAGLDRIGTVGLRGTSIEEVCRLAGVSIRNFYEEFTGLPNVFVAVHRRIIEQTTQAARTAVEAVADASFAERLEIAFGSALRSIFADRRAVRVCYIEILGGGRVIEAHRLAWRDEFATAIVDHVTAEVAPGRAPERDLRLAALAVVGAFNELGHAAALHPERFPLEHLVHELVRFSLTIFANP